MIGAFPSSLGGFHDNLQESAIWSVTSSGPSGAPGLSENNKENLT
jgi:hypothetical protein